MPDTPLTPETVPAKQYVVVARRYRPQAFEELIGQEHVAQALSNAIADQSRRPRLSVHRRPGRGQDLGRADLGQGAELRKGPQRPSPATSATSATASARGEDVDVLEIDGASNRGIDEIRQLRQNVNVRPSRSRFKIYIIDEVHMLTREAFNALLKTLEEPPEHVKFIFCTTEPTKIPITILSRCQRFDFAGILTQSIAQRLRQIVAAEGVEADPRGLGGARPAGGRLDARQPIALGATAGLFAGRDHRGRRSRHAGHGGRGAAGGDWSGTSIERDAAGALADLDAAVHAGVDAAATHRAAFRLPPRLHGGGGRLPSRGVSLHLALRRGARSRRPASGWGWKRCWP